MSETPIARKIIPVQLEDVDLRSGQFPGLACQRNTLMGKKLMISRKIMRMRLDKVMNTVLILFDRSKDPLKRDQR